MDLVTLQQLMVSLGLGLLLGLERERTERSIAGIRTFPFIALFGTVCAQIEEATGSWMIAVGLIALAALVVMANFLKHKGQEATAEPGMTTEVATLLVYALGAMIAEGLMATAVVLAGGMAMLLHFKRSLHGFAKAVGDKDMRAIIQFVLITLVILPILPNQDHGPYGVLNPFKIWLMVVLIVGIGLCGYVAYKLFGARAGTILGGVIGGMVSSTATTVSYARRAATEPGLAKLGALVIMIASTISMVRVLIEVGATAPHLFQTMAPPLGAMFGACCLITAGLYFVSRDGRAEMPEQENPTEIRAALVFGGLYALVVLGVAFAKDHFGDNGLYVVAAISGLTDMDAIALSSSQLAARGDVEPATAWRAILLGSMANFVFKLGTVVVLGSRALAGRVAVAFALALCSGACIFWFWPVYQVAGN